MPRGFSLIELARLLISHGDDAVAILYALRALQEAGPSAVEKWEAAKPVGDLVAPLIDELRDSEAFSGAADEPADESDEVSRLLQLVEESPGAGAEPLAGWDRDRILAILELLRTVLMVVLPLLVAEDEE